MEGQVERKLTLAIGIEIEARARGLGRQSSANKRATRICNSCRLAQPDFGIFVCEFSLAKLRLGLRIEARTE